MDTVKRYRFQDVGIASPFELSFDNEVTLQFLHDLIGKCMEQTGVRAESIELEVAPMARTVEAIVWPRGRNCIRFAAMNTRPIDLG